MAAGINEAEADVVANRLSRVQAQKQAQGDETVVVKEPKTPVKGPGLGALDVQHREVMYGTVFGSGSTGSSSDSKTLVEESSCRKGLSDGYSYRV